LIKYLINGSNNTFVYDKLKKCKTHILFYRNNKIKILITLLRKITLRFYEFTGCINHTNYY